jgi:RNA polymerase sigma-70 factor (ECF subfamily)
MFNLTQPQCESTDSTGNAPSTLIVSEPDNSSPAASATPSVDWGHLVEKIKAGDGEGLEELYRIFSRGVRFYLCRQLGPQELEDKVHDTFLIVVHAIQKGDLREPERLMGFVRTIVRRQVAAHIDEVVQVRRDQTDLESGVAIVDRKGNPEERAIGQQNEDLMVKVLRSMSERDREILTRFYLAEQTQDQICREMKLTDTQFRLLKSRAKGRFGDLGRRQLHMTCGVSKSLRSLTAALH